MALNLKNLEQLLKKKQAIKGQPVLVRVDLNVPIKRGKVSDTTRMERVLPTIRALQKAKAKVVLLSHFGRPEGAFVRDLSFAPLVDTLSELLGSEVKFGVDCIGDPAHEAIKNLGEGEVVLLENLRFHKGEEANDKKFAKALSELGKFYVNDAFSCSHRAHASIVGITKELEAFAGLELGQELENLERVLKKDSAKKTKARIAAIVGGSKISTKIDLLNSLVTQVDALLIGGGMANTFLYASGHDVGNSLCEKHMKKTALTIMKRAALCHCDILLPSDVVIAKELTEAAVCNVVPATKIPSGYSVFDIGPETVSQFSAELKRADTVLWNGPMGAFETSPFDVGSISLARTVAYLTEYHQLKSVAGGGDVLAAISAAGLSHRFTYVSTAGGAFLEWLEGKTLPGVEVLKDA